MTDKIILWHVFSDAESDVSGDSDSLNSVNSDSELGEPTLERYTCCWLLVIVIRKLTYLCVPMSVCYQLLAEHGLATAGNVGCHDLHISLVIVCVCVCVCSVCVGVGGLV